MFLQKTALLSLYFFAVNLFSIKCNKAGKISPIDL